MIWESLKVKTQEKALNSNLDKINLEIESKYTENEIGVGKFKRAIDEIVLIDLKAEGNTNGKSWMTENNVLRMEKIRKVK